MPTRIADVEIPDTKLAAEATELVREATSPLIFHHSRRVYLFGALRGREQGLRYDPELLYVAAMFHDLGLTEKYRRTDQRFEIDGADEAHRFLLAHGIPEEAATRVWTGIALHTTPEIPLHMAPEIALDPATHLPRHCCSRLPQVRYRRARPTTSAAGHARRATTSLRTVLREQA
jgi:hypothetical protein